MAALWTAFPLQAQQNEQQTFPSAEAAAQALYQAVHSNDEHEIAKILGGPSDLTSSSDGEQDKKDRETFVEKFQQMHRLSRDPDGTLTLYIGVENWPFPVPVAQKNGSWRFDPEEGAKEITYRRIGDNELTAIATCHQFISAAKRRASNAGETELTESSPDSLAAKAAAGASRSTPVLLQGYYFRVIPQSSGVPGKFVLIAYPAEYRPSGVKTFAVTDKDVVFEKDLGANTPSVVGAMTAFHKDGSWRAAE